MQRVTTATPADTFGFVPTGTGNDLLKGDGFYVSYRANEAPDIFGIHAIATLFGDPCGTEPWAGETALYSPDGVWMILQGDYRREYATAVPQGFAACEAVYRANIAARSAWSTDGVRA